jgi:hypothetical protein
MGTHLKVWQRRGLTQLLHFLLANSHSAHPSTPCLTDPSATSLLVCFLQRWCSPTSANAPVFVSDRLPYSHRTVPGPLLRLTERQLAGLIPHDAPAEITQWRTTVLLSSRGTEGGVVAMIWVLFDKHNIKNVHKVVQEFTTLPATSDVSKQCQNGRQRIIAETSPPSVQLSEMAVRYP